LDFGFKFGMQQFVVPQFIDVEDKIFGPITVRQFLILLTGGLLIFIAYRFADFALFVVFLAIIGGLSLVVAFVKINGQTFHYFLLNFVQYFSKPGQRVWHKDFSVEELNYWRKLGMEGEAEVAAPEREHSRARMRDLSLIVNTGGYYRGEE
jgi:hypothetical protein